MSDEPSTSGEGAYSENEKSKLLQQALSEAGAKRAQAQRKVRIDLEEGPMFF